VTSFVICAVAMVAMTLAFLLPPLLRRHHPPGLGTQARANLGILQQQFQELQTEQANDHLTPAQRQLVQRELERRVLEETRAAPCQTNRSLATTTALVLALGLPLAAGALYFKVGNTEVSKLPEPVAAEATGGMDEVEQMVERLAQRMASSPDDLTGWTMLARSLGALQRFPESSRAYSRAVELAPNDAQLLADYADVLAIAQGNDARGEPERLIARALKVAPDNLKALALAGSAAYERNDLATARTHWAKALALAPAGSSFALGMARNLDGVNGALTSIPSPANAPVRSANSVAGSVTLSASLPTQVLPTDTLFIVARGVGPDGVVQRVPLAVDRRNVGSWPVRFTLDDSMAMSPNAKLSGFSQVQVSARISRSGDALPQPGDLFAAATVVPVGTQSVVLELARQTP